MKAELRTSDITDMDSRERKEPRMIPKLFVSMNGSMKLPFMALGKTVTKVGCSVLIMLNFEVMSSRELNA